MSTSPDENPVPRVVTFTDRGNAALDQLAEAFAADCDGSPASIANILERVLEDDIEELAESLSETAKPAAHTTLVGLDVEAVGPAAHSPDLAARRRLSPRPEPPGGNPGGPGPGVGR